MPAIIFLLVDSEKIDVTSTLDVEPYKLVFSYTPNVGNPPTKKEATLYFNSPDGKS